MSARLDTIMAYVDGELAPPERAAFEAELAADAALAEEVAAHRRLRESLAGAYAPVLDEPVPLTLSLAAQAANDPPQRTGAARMWAAMAACLVVGVLAGRLGAPAPVAIGADVPARTELARALDHRLAAEPGVVRIGLTFRDGQGRWCRTFESAPDRLAGLACRGGGRWRLTTATAWAPASGPQYRAAASETPPAVLAAVDQALRGEALDATQERAARDAGWRP